MHLAYRLLAHSARPQYREQIRQTASTNAGDCSQRKRKSIHGIWERDKWMEIYPFSEQGALDPSDAMLEWRPYLSQNMGEGVIERWDASIVMFSRD